MEGSNTINNHSYLICIHLYVLKGLTVYEILL